MYRNSATILVILTTVVLLPASCWALDVMVNQVGFEPSAPKVFRAQRTSDYAGDGSFTVRRVSDNAVVHSGNLTRKGGLWDKYYWECDFSSFVTPGDYYVRATVDTETDDSYDFTIADGVLVDQTGVLTYQYFWTQRCGVAVPGWHGVCHADDGLRKDTEVHIDAVGAWHDSGDYNKFTQGFTADAVFGLLWLYESHPSYYDAIDTDTNGIGDILDEALHAARWLAKMVEPSGHVLKETQKRRSGPTWVRPESDTNNIIGDWDDRWIEPGDEITPQEITVCASLIKMHYVLAEKGLPTEDFADKALAIWDHRVALAVAEGGHNNLGSGSMHIFAGLDLYDHFGQQDCYDRALQRVQEMAATAIANPTFYDTIGEAGGYELGALAWFARNYPDTYPADEARQAVIVLMDHNMDLADDPIGLIRRDYSGSLDYFPTDPDWNAFFLGLNRVYLLYTYGAIQAYRTVDDPDYLRFAFDQYNWVMGANYDTVCMMEDAGDFDLPRYHTRYDTIPGHESGEQPGVVPNGYVRVYETGLPHIDFVGTRYQSNEGWLINNGAYAMALAEMHDLETNRVTILNSTFDSGADGWATDVWRSGAYAYGNMTWSSDGGNPGGGMHSTGTGQSDNDDRGTREGGEIYKVIPTAGCVNVKVGYDLRTGTLGAPWYGWGVGTGTVDHNDVQEQLTVYYSTDGGSNWIEASPWLGRDALLDYTTYGTREIDLSAIGACGDNPNFALRFRWQFNNKPDVGDFGDLDNIIVTGMPIETTPPAPVTNFAAAAGDQQLTLSWTNPSDPDFACTMIRYSTLDYPASPTDGSLLAERPKTPGSNDSLVHGGLINGTTYYYSAFARDYASNYASGAHASAAPVGPICFSDSFSYPDGSLNGIGGWTGSATGEIVVESQSVKVTGGPGARDASHDAPCPGQGGLVGVLAKIRSGAGVSTMWSLLVDDAAGNNLARWYGTGTSARGRIGGGTQVTDSQPLTGGWDALYVKINLAADTSSFFFNGLPIGTLDHSEFGAGDLIGYLRFERIDNANAAGDYVYLDDLVAGLVDTTPPDASVGPPSTVLTRTGPVSYEVNFSETVYGFGSSGDVQIDATGSAAVGSVNVTGSAAGPYIVTLSSITGGGTLGITVKSGACVDAAGNPNTASAASATFKVLAADGSIASIKELADGTPVEVAYKVLYMKQATFGYIEELERTSGIRAEGSIPSSEDDLVLLTGTMQTTAGGERYIQVEEMVSDGTGAILPVGVTNRALLADLMEGLYVRAWGVVKTGSITGNSFVITDGSDEAGIKVITPTAPGVTDGEFVTVAGAAGYESGRAIYKQ